MTNDLSGASKASEPTTRPSARVCLLRLRRTEDLLTGAYSSLLLALSETIVAKRVVTRMATRFASRYLV